MKKTVLVAAMLIGISINLPADAKSTSLSDLKDFSIQNTKASDKGKAFDSKHWAYKTLRSVTDKYGVLIGKPGENFDTSKPISRNEAAIILVNLMGKIEDENIKMSEADAAKVEILQQELMGEINKLSGRVAAVENTVAELKGSVSTLEESSKKTWKHALGEDFKITGGLQAGYTAVTNRGSHSYSDYSPNFGLPYSEVTITGKLNDKFAYKAQMVPTRNFSDTTFNGLLRDVYVSSSIIPKHNVYFGQVTRPFGMEAQLSPLEIDFVDYSQSSRKILSNSAGTYDPHNQDVGAMIKGDLGLVTYGLGTFNGTGNNAFDGNRKTSLAAQVAIKPLYKLPQYGSFEAGASLLNQNTGYRHRLLGYHGSYTYKRFNVKGEFMHREGFTAAGQTARGWVIDAKYALTDKLTVLARYDNFDPNIKGWDDKSVEYIAGVNYMFRDNIGILINLVNVNNQSGRDSRRIGFLTQYMF